MKVDLKKFYHFTRDKKAELFMDSNPIYIWQDNKPNRRMKENQFDYSPRWNLSSKEYKHLEFLEEVLSIYKKGGVLSQINDILYNLYYHNYHLNARYWELIFERIRFENYNHLPSRTGCLYVVEDKDDLRKWIYKAKEDGLKDFKFYQLELTGEIHKTHGGWLELDVEIEDVVIRNAHSYWKGKTYEKESELDTEILFKGTSKVIKKYNSLEEIK